MGLIGVRIVLVEPAGPMNVGAIARAMKNFGLQKLFIVNPQCDPLGEEALKMSVHAKDILESASLVASLPEALKGCTRAVATSARVRAWDNPLETPRAALPWLLEETENPTALIFGREDRGLSNEELNYAQRFIRIPSSENYPSLNLATAVALCCYELSQIESAGDTDNINEEFPVSKQELAPLDVVEAYYQQLESLLLDIGYLYPHTALSRMQKIRQLYNRALLQPQEVAMLRGVLRQVEWALSHQEHLAREGRREEGDREK
jgi:tRNA/rRNA methyltransferase